MELERVRRATLFWSLSPPAWLCWSKPKLVVGDVVTLVNFYPVILLFPFPHVDLVDDAAKTMVSPGEQRNSLLGLNVEISD